MNYEQKELQRIIDDIKENPNDGYNTASIQVVSDNQKTKHLNIPLKTLEVLIALFGKD
jgi:hypothetical protein